MHQPRVLFLSWRDLDHPEAGGAEKYLVTVAEGLAARGYDVTIQTASYPGASPHEMVRGVRYHRSGGKYSIYPRALLATLLRRHRPDVVVDVQNGVPYLSPMVTSRPVINLVHHVHREQWPVVFGPRTARVGWWMESRLAPRVYRHSSYVTVSPSTHRELAALGVTPNRISIIHNGTDASEGELERSATPRVVVLGRLVPQKRVELAIEAVAELRRAAVPDLTLDIVGSGWWEPNLRELVAARGLGDAVVFHGHVSEVEKGQLLAQAWVHALPSLKEGWGLVVVEAGVHGTPTVAFRSAGGPCDSIQDGVSGILVDGPHEPADLDGFTAALETLLVDDHRRAQMSVAARAWVAGFHWEESVGRWDALLRQVTDSAPQARPADTPVRTATT